MLSRMGLDCDDIQCLRRGICHVLNDRLRRGQRVCGRIGTAHRLHVQPRLRFSIHDNDRVCGQHEHVRAVWCWAQLRWQWRPSGCMLLQPCVGVRITDIEQLHGNVVHVSALCGGYFVSGRSGTADAVYVRAWVLLAWSDTRELFKHGPKLQNVHCRTFLPRQCVTADSMQLQCRVFLCSGGRFSVQRDDRFVCPLRPRRILHWLCRPAGAVFSRVHLIHPGERLFCVSTRAIRRRQWEYRVCRVLARCLH